MQNTLPVINYQKPFVSPMPEEERQAWSQMGNNDQAFRFIWNIYSRSIYNSALKMLRSIDHAEQVLSDVFMYIVTQKGFEAYALRYLLQKTTLFLIKYHLKVLADGWCIEEDNGLSYDDWIKTQKPMVIAIPQA